MFATEVASEKDDQTSEAMINYRNLLCLKSSDQENDCADIGISAPSAKLI